MQQAEIKQRVDISSQQQPVGYMIGVRSPVGTQVGTFEGRGRVKAGDGAPPAVSLQQRRPKRGLSGGQDQLALSDLDGKYQRSGGKKPQMLSDRLLELSSEKRPCTEPARWGMSAGVLAELTRDLFIPERPSWGLRDVFVSPS